MITGKSSRMWPLFGYDPESIFVSKELYECCLPKLMGVKKATIVLFGTGGEIEKTMEWEKFLINKQKYE